MIGCFGDSITGGTWTPGQAWPELVNVDTVNRGIGGTSLAFPCAENSMPPLADWIPPTARRLNITHAVICAGICDLIRTDDMSVLASATCSIIDRLEAQGIVTWWATVTPYRADAWAADALDARRLRWNDWLRARVPDRLIDWEGVLRDGKYMKAEWSFDSLHPNVVGQQRLADVFDQVFTL